MPRDAGDVSAALMAIGRDASALFATAQAALEDNKLTIEELAALVRDLDRLQRVTSEARQIVTARINQAAGDGATRGNL